MLPFKSDFKPLSPKKPSAEIPVPIPTPQAVPAGNVFTLNVPTANALSLARPQQLPVSQGTSGVQRPVEPIKVINPETIPKIAEYQIIEYSNKLAANIVDIFNQDNNGVNPVHAFRHISSSSLKNNIYSIVASTVKQLPEHTTNWLNAITYAPVVNDVYAQGGTALYTQPYIPRMVANTEKKPNNDLLTSFPDLDILVPLRSITSPQGWNFDIGRHVTTSLRSSSSNTFDATGWAPNGTDIIRCHLILYILQQNQIDEFQLNSAIRSYASHNEVGPTLLERQSWITSDAKKFVRKYTYLEQVLNTNVTMDTTYLGFTMTEAYDTTVMEYMNLKPMRISKPNDYYDIVLERVNHIYVLAYNYAKKIKEKNPGLWPVGLPIGSYGIIFDKVTRVPIKILASTWHHKHLMTIEQFISDCDIMANTHIIKNGFTMPNNISPLHKASVDNLIPLNLAILLKYCSAYKDWSNYVYYRLRLDTWFNALNQLRTDSFSPYVTESDIKDIKNSISIAFLDELDTLKKPSDVF